LETPLRAIFPYLIGLSSIMATMAAQGDESPRFVLNDGDRIVLVGDTLIERDQRYGYLETMLTLQNPDKDLTFRNLGWSGDTVSGLSRAGFDPPEAGYRQLIEQVLAAKPTVLIVGYGMADSFDGEAGLSRFVAGLNRLLDAVAATRARVVLLSPIAHARLGAPWPDPSAHNAMLERHGRSIAEVARSRGAWFIDLYGPSRAREAQDQAPITDDGIVLNEAGYRFLWIRRTRGKSRGSRWRWTSRSGRYTGRRSAGSRRRYRACGSG
jgi:lysophospholipase L1-like esterase